MVKLVRELVRVKAHERGVLKRPENVKNKAKVGKKAGTGKTTKGKTQKRDARGRFVKRR